jgi:hypothetical protein
MRLFRVGMTFVRSVSLVFARGTKSTLLSSSFRTILFSFEAVSLSFELLLASRAILDDFPFEYWTAIPGSSFGAP